MLPFYESAEPNIPAASLLWDSLPAGTCKSSPFSMTGPTACRQGPMVRIHLPPAESPLRRGRNDVVVEGRRSDDQHRSEQQATRLSLLMVSEPARPSRTRLPSR